MWHVELWSVILFAWIACLHALNEELAWVRVDVVHVCYVDFLVELFIAEGTTIYHTKRLKWSMFSIFSIVTMWSLLLFTDVSSDLLQLLIFAISTIGHLYVIWMHGNSTVEECRIAQCFEFIENARAYFDFTKFLSSMRIVSRLLLLSLLCWSLCFSGILNCLKLDVILVKRWREIPAARCILGIKMLT